MAVRLGIPVGTPNRPWSFSPGTAGMSYFSTAGKAGVPIWIEQYRRTDICFSLHQLDHGHYKSGLERARHRDFFIVHDLL